MLSKARLSRNVQRSVFLHSERLVRADSAGLSAETDTLAGMSVRVTLSTEDFEISFRKDFSEDMSLL